MPAGDFSPAWKRGFSLTAEQLEASRAERMRQNGVGTLTLEDARTWLEETGLCLFLPRKQFSGFVAPSFVEAVAGERNQAPSTRIVAQAEELLVRLETDGVAVRLNLLGQPGEQPDFVVAGWVLPYVYALRGDRDWRRSPQLTGSRAVSPLATQAYKVLEAGEATIPQLKHTLGREVTEGAVLRAITELWQQLRIIPVISAPGHTARWQLLRVRFQKAIAEGASTSQVTAISVLASIYLQAVIAASMEEVEMFLAPLTARSKVREVLRGLVATRQVHTISMGHAPHYYVAGTLPEFSAPSSIFSCSYSSSAVPASMQFLRSWDRDYDAHEPHAPATQAAPAAESPAAHRPEEIAPSIAAKAEDKPQPVRSRLSRKPVHARDRKPAASSMSRVNRGSTRTGEGSRHGSAAHRSHGASSNGHSNNGSNNGHSNGHTKQNGSHANGTNGAHKSKPAAAQNLRNGHVSASKSAAKSSARPGSRLTAAARKEVRTDARSRRKPALSTSAKTGNRARYGFSASSGQRAKKRG
jgi:hypothetical protein